MSAILAMGVLMKLHKRLSRTVLGQGGLIVAATIAMAGSAAARIPMALPEPSSLSLVGLGIVGAIVAYRVRRRK